MSVHSLMHKGLYTSVCCRCIWPHSQAFPASNRYVKPEGRNLGMAASSAWPGILTGWHKDACKKCLNHYVLLILGVLNLHVVKSLSY